MRVIGIDEAGYGPVLGPLAIAAVAVEAEDPAAVSSSFAAAVTGVRDSKRLHRSGNLAPLESVVLAGLEWLCGLAPANAAELFALMGEPEAARAGLPWMTDAALLRLPVAAASVPRWQLPGLRPLPPQGRLLHPRALNEAAARGCNRAAIELTAVAELCAALAPAGPAEILLDRLGGRMRYEPLLQAAWPGQASSILAEEPRSSRYRVDLPGGAVGLEARVGADAALPLVALASCLAKYSRELHMLLFNRYWCGVLPWLQPTAGYPQDATRWLQQIGRDHLAFWGMDLKRGKCSDFPIAS